MTTVNPENLKHFTSHAQDWWDPKGPFKPLHALNPERLRFIKTQIDKHFNLCQQVPEQKVSQTAPLENLEIIDVGCGGGLVCEPLARLGAKVTGLDAGLENIDAAQNHSILQDLDITYLNQTAEDFLKMHPNHRFDVVLALEVVEHVENVKDFLESCTKLLKPGGLLILSTLNRTLKGYALGIVAAEYLLRWVPKGTHQWQKFFKPSELALLLEDLNCQTQTIQGLSFNPLNGSWSLSADLDINYFLSATKGF